MQVLHSPPNFVKGFENWSRDPDIAKVPLYVLRKGIASIDSFVHIEGLTRVDPQAFAPHDT